MKRWFQKHRDHRHTTARPSSRFCRARRLTIEHCEERIVLSGSSLVAGVASTPALQEGGYISIASNGFLQSDADNFVVADSSSTAPKAFGNAEGFTVQQGFIANAASNSLSIPDDPLANTQWDLFNPDQQLNTGQQVGNLNFLGALPRLRGDINAPTAGIVDFTANDLPLGYKIAVAGVSHDRADNEGFPAGHPMLISSSSLDTPTLIGSGIITTDAVGVLGFNSNTTNDSVFDSNSFLTHDRFGPRFREHSTSGDSEVVIRVARPDTGSSVSDLFDSEARIQNQTAQFYSPALHETPTTHLPVNRDAFSTGSPGMASVLPNTQNAPSPAGSGTSSLLAISSSTNTTHFDTAIPSSHGHRDAEEVFATVILRSSNSSTHVSLDSASLADPQILTPSPIDISLRTDADLVNADERVEEIVNDSPGLRGRTSRMLVINEPIQVAELGPTPHHSNQDEGGAIDVVAATATTQRAYEAQLSEVIAANLNRDGALHFATQPEAKPFVAELARTVAFETFSPQQVVEANRVEQASQVQITAPMPAVHTLPDTTKSPATTTSVGFNALPRYATAVEQTPGPAATRPNEPAVDDHAAVRMERVDEERQSAQATSFAKWPLLATVVAGYLLIERREQPNGQTVQTPPRRQRNST